MIEWNVKRYNSNAKTFYDYNVLKYHTETIKKLKKKCETIEEFSEELKHEIMYHYWSKCEHEMIIKKDSYHIWLAPLIGDELVRFDVTNDNSFDWVGFANKHIGKQITKNEAKVDIYDQLEYRWDEFIRYCWMTHFPYERKKK